MRTSPADDASVLPFITAFAEVAGPILICQLICEWPERVDETDDEIIDIVTAKLTLRPLRLGDIKCISIAIAPREVETPYRDHYWGHRAEVTFGYEGSPGLWRLKPPFHLASYRAIVDEDVVKLLTGFRSTNQEAALEWMEQELTIMRIKLRPLEPMITHFAQRREPLVRTLVSDALESMT